MAATRWRAISAIAVLASIALFWVAARAADDTPAEKKTDAPAKNPYLPRKGMSVEDLQAYIERMQEAPESIRNRPGFAEGMAVAAERILDSNPKGRLRTFAVSHLLDALHQSADLHDDQAADARLAELAAKYAEDSDKKIASLAALYALEQRVLKADDLDQEKLTALLDDVKTALVGKDLDVRHIRLASATVHAINALKDDAEATRRLKDFSALFAASSNTELARYGRKLANTAGREMKPSEWIGKPMELAGVSTEGAKFDISQYKGKVVLVDFWATWCGPCRAALPDLKDTYEKFHQQGLEVVGVSLDRELSDLTQFIDKEKIPWINLVGEEKEGEIKFPLAEKYGILGIPTTFLVSRDGKIATQVLGAQDLTKQIEKLIAEKGDAPKDGSAKTDADHPASN